MDTSIIEAMYKKKQLTHFRYEVPDEDFGWENRRKKKKDAQTLKGRYCLGYANKAFVLYGSRGRAKSVYIMSLCQRSCRLPTERDLGPIPSQ